VEIRPRLEVRMPTFGFNDEELNALTRYFAALDEVSYPFDQRFTVAHDDPLDLLSGGERLASPDNLKCFRCHVRGDAGLEETADNWAPDLAIAARRLRREWIQEWIRDPQAIFPGTRMPQYYYEPGAASPYVDRGRSDTPILDGDTDRQIEALAAYVMSLGRHPGP